MQLAFEQHCPRVTTPVRNLHHLYLHQITSSLLLHQWIRSPNQCHWISSSSCWVVLFWTGFFWVVLSWILECLTLLCVSISFFLKLPWKRKKQQTHLLLLSVHLFQNVGQTFEGSSLRDVVAKVYLSVCLCVSDFKLFYTFLNCLKLVPTYPVVKGGVQSRKGWSAES